MATLEKAIEIAARAHVGVLDKQDQPYILHPLRVMMGVEGLSAQIVAVLHDVVEDTDLTLDDVKAEGFSEEILAALALVTHRDEQSYAEYVVACQANPIARQVKLSDLRDNSSLARMLLRADRFPRDSARMLRYLLSYQFLSGELTAEQYCQLMEPYEG